MRRNINQLVVGASLLCAEGAFPQAAFAEGPAVQAPAVMQGTMPTRPSVALPEMERLTFDMAVTRTVEHNPSATIAIEEIRHAESLLAQVRSASLPTLQGNLNYTRIDADRVVAGAIVQPINSFNADLVLAVPLVSPQNWARWSHARENVDVAKLSAASIGRDLAVTAARTYLAIVTQHHTVEITSRARTIAQAHLDFSHQRFVGGFGTRVDEVRAAQELASDTSQEEAARLQLIRLCESLGVLTGGDHPVDVSDTIDLPPLPSSEDARKEAPTLRADIKLFRGRLDAAHHLVRDHWTDFMPTVIGSFLPFYQTPPTPTIPNSGWQATLLLNWQIYDGGLRYGLQRERKALQNEAQVGLEGELRQVSSDLRTSDQEVSRTQVAFDQARNAAQLAEKALELTTLAYKAGASTNIEVIDAERTARDADTAAANAEDAVRQAQLDVLIASGRFPRAR